MFLAEKMGGPEPREARGSLRAVVPSKDKIRGEGCLPIGRGDMKEGDLVYTYVQALGALYR